MSIKAQVETIRSLAFGSISGSFTAVGSALLNPARIVCITNNTDGDMFFSIDGTNNQLFIPKNSFKLFDLTTNKSSYDSVFAFSAGTIFYVKQSTAPSEGDVYIEVVYAA